MSMFENENEISPANPKNANARIKCIKYVDSYKYCCVVSRYLRMNDRDIGEP